MLIRPFFAGLSYAVSGEAGDSVAADVTRVLMGWRLLPEDEAESERG